jgi:hypothetical protein
MLKSRPPRHGIPELASIGDDLTQTGSRKHETMTTRDRLRQLASAMVVLAALGPVAASADIYTWVDASGNVNLSNRPPREGTRVTHVFREDPAVRASAEAARATAQREELRALNERVDQLERDLEAARRPAPVVYAPPVTPAPVAYPPVVAQTFVSPSPSGYADCADPWGGCFSPGFFGFYPSGVVVLSAPRSHRVHPARTHVRTPALPSFPKPVGVLPDPVNLFPGHRR